jgi:hypothetical protein
MRLKKKSKFILGRMGEGINLYRRSFLVEMSRIQGSITICCHKLVPQVVTTRLLL